jgi:hypothetical protein
MSRIILSATLGLALLIAGADWLAVADDQPKADPKSGVSSSCEVRLRFPKDAPFAEVKKVLESIKVREVIKEVFVEAGEDAERASAAVVAGSTTPSKSVAAVVESLLDCGVRKVSVEVRD